MAVEGKVFVSEATAQQMILAEVDKDIENAKSSSEFFGWATVACLGAWIASVNHDLSCLGAAVVGIPVTLGAFMACQFIEKALQQRKDQLLGSDIQVEVKHRIPTTKSQELMVNQFKNNVVQKPISVEGNSQETEEFLSSAIERDRCCVLGYDCSQYATADALMEAVNRGVGRGDLNPGISKLSAFFSMLQEQSLVISAYADKPILVVFREMDELSSKDQAGVDNFLLGLRAAHNAKASERKGLDLGFVVTTAAPIGQLTSNDNVFEKIVLSK